VERAKLRPFSRLRICATRTGYVIELSEQALGSQPLAQACASQIRSQQQRQRGWKLYSLHAPEVECIGKGKASLPYEFGVKVLIAISACAPGGQGSSRRETAPP
jgi:IS5 family transposase